MPLSGQDLDLLDRAVTLSGNGFGRVHPNPVVGAVVVRDGEVVGEGWHDEHGGPHAEVVALDATAPGLRAGSTLYVSLEPCCHQGKTPPCTDAILAAGVERVVVASDDPSAKAKGRGLGILRDEGVVIDVADPDLAVARRARRANQAFRKHAKTGLPWVLFKSAMTIDGKVATRTGDSKWISSEESRRLAHTWRASVDAVAVGIGTALADDPQLTARVEREDGRPVRQPERVVFDSTARLPIDGKLVEEAPEIGLTVVVSRAAPRTAVDGLVSAGADVIVATGSNESARISSAVAQLGERGLSAILLEGGPHLAGAFSDAGEIDEIRLFLAPLIIGGSGARDPLAGQGVDLVKDATRAREMTCESIGDDLLVRATIEDW